MSTLLELEMLEELSEESMQLVTTLILYLTNTTVVPKVSLMLKICIDKLNKSALALVLTRLRFWFRVLNWKMRIPQMLSYPLRNMQTLSSHKRISLRFLLRTWHPMLSFLLLTPNVPNFLLGKELNSLNMVNLLIYMTMTILFLTRRKFLKTWSRISRNVLSKWIASLKINSTKIKVHLNRK